MIDGGRAVLMGRHRKRTRRSAVASSLMLVVMATAMVAVTAVGIGVRRL
ncbi:hypothetical protein [Nocardia bovistercoris]|uniref:Uncharacterized protein n=1 Tax=Nocardia bovistercoris TaxID=2785916 RepID=A0A931N588_9NOCA|nr:hypothetical protein [Nocardia bovistercoris]MBH0779584.1 hypothetical protein [Nocardia bovistercoris]